MMQHVERLEGTLQARLSTGLRSCVGFLQLTLDMSRYECGRRLFARLFPNKLSQVYYNQYENFYQYGERMMTNENIDSL